jgi:hypothetical protein
MGEICEKHNVLKRSCYICELEEENKQLTEQVKELRIKEENLEKIAKCWVAIETSDDPDVSAQLSYFYCYVQDVLTPEQD